jgi:hypothetical protein
MQGAVRGSGATVFPTGLQRLLVLPSRTSVSIPDLNGVAQLCDAFPC